MADYAIDDGTIVQDPLDPKDPTYCPACLSGIGPTDPNDPILKIAEPVAAAE